MSSFDANAILKKYNKTPKLIEQFAKRLQTDLLPLLEKEGSLLENYVDPSELDKVLKETHGELAKAIEKAQSPLRVSLVGPFASGKTVTVCTLLGKPNLLPRAASPTSGNVVEVQIIKPDSATAAQKKYPMECILFSPLELEEMLRDYYQQLRSSLPSIKELPTTPGFLIAEYIRLRTEIRQLLQTKWVEYKQGGAGRISFEVLTNLAHLYFILATIERYLSAHTDLKSSESLVLPMPYTEDDKTSGERLVSVTMLDMQWSPEQMEPQILDNKIAVLWQDAVLSQTTALKQACADGTIKNVALRALLPLYKRVVLTFEVDLPQGWGEIERIAFLDFPGVGADSRRDTYLCVKELPLAHVNLLFFLATRPTTKDTQKLLNVINEVREGIKKVREGNVAQLAERIVPVINFFDGYARLPEAAPTGDTSDDIVKAQQATERAKNFFQQERVVGIGIVEGFDVFDESIVGPLYAGAKNQGYFLLSPIAAMPPEVLDEKEREHFNVYQHQKERYQQLFNDLDISLRWLRKNRTENAQWIEKFERLHLALSGYLKNGGMTDLRDELVSKLKKNGLRFVAEDALPFLRDALERLEKHIIRHLPIEEDEPFTGDERPPEEARLKIQLLWDQMKDLTLQWSNKADVVKLTALRSRLANEDTANGEEMVSLLDWCESQVLHRVLADDFWQPWVNFWPAQPKQETPLSELRNRYQTLLTDLKAWSQKAIDLAIKDTLQRLNTYRLEVELLTGKKSVHFQDVYNELFNDYVRHAEGIAAHDVGVLKEFFSLTSLEAALQQRLAECLLQQGPQPNNDKMPFNDNQVLFWSAAEVMKIQQQLIITLQRQIASDFALYTSVFFEQFRKLLNERLYGAEGHKDHSIDARHQQFDQPGNVFDKLAKVVQETPDPDDLTLKARHKKAQELVAKILTLWHELLGV